MKRIVGWVGLLMVLGCLAPGVHATSSPKVTVQLIITNAQGSVVAKMTPDGVPTYSADYRPYGTTQSTPQAGPGYTGHVMDPTSGLVYMQQRYYDQEVGRFISPDPVAPTPGNVFNFGRYTYANDNPVVNIDPTGMSCLRGDSSNCNPRPIRQNSSSSSKKPTPPVPPPASQKNATTLASVTVTASALPASGPTAWGEIGEGAADVVGGALSPVIAAGAIIVGGYWPATMGAAPCTMPATIGPCGRNIMYSKGGRQNVRDTGLIGVSDKEIKRRLKDPATPSAEKKRLQKEQKASGQRNRRKRKN